jgi:hypothetical protein
LGVRSLPIGLFQLSSNAARRANSGIDVGDAQ